MHSPDPSFCEPEPLSESNEGTQSTWRKSVSATLTNLKGWQAIPVAVVALYCLLGIFGPVLAPFRPNEGTVATRLCPPLAMDALTTAPHPTSRAADCSASNILGTDHIGRDIFSRLLHGARASLLVVGSSVIIGTIAGVAVGILINGMRSRARSVALLILSATIVPFGFFVFNQPEALAILNVIPPTGYDDDPIRRSTLISFSCASALIALALITVAYRFDSRCLSHWSNGVTAANGLGEFCSRFHQQIKELRPWIILAAIASGALIMPRSLYSAFQTPEVTWTLEREYLLEHIGMFSPLVPMVLIPLAFVTLGVWWVYRHILRRFTVTSSINPATECNVDDAEEEPEPGTIRPFAESVAMMRLKRWLPFIIAIVAVLICLRFGVYELWPNIRYVVQDSSFSWESPRAREFRERSEALECATEVSSKLMSFINLPLEERVVDPGQRCLDLYYQQRNAPSHHKTFEFILRMVSLTVALALVGAVTAAALSVAISGWKSPVRRAVQIGVVLIAFTGLTIAFGHSAWLTVIVHWIAPSILLSGDKGLAIQWMLAMLQDFSTGFGIAFLLVEVASPSLRFGAKVSKSDAFRMWTSYLVACVCLTSGLIVIFHFPFPSILLFIDDQLAIIVDPSEEQYFSSPGSLFRNWLWTYWFALIGYAAIVFGFFAAAIWGFKRLATTDKTAKARIQKGG